MKRRKFRTALLVLLLSVVLVQFLPVDRSAPAVNPAQDFVAVTSPSPQLGQMIKDACYDCHSYETEYPWYSYVAPVAQWLQGHVNEGRKNLNFSIWTTYSAKKTDKKLKEAIEMVKEKEMPLQSFTWGHPEARLSDAQRTEITDWFQKFRTSADSDRNQGEEDGEEEE